ncbi:hypothetical protein BC628DRAFT_1371962 [Trametes gibbosa]|nr:hypothetical protein BC628DRAFT_1371962 [Trametes gibbosa]
MEAAYLASAGEYAHCGEVWGPGTGPTLPSVLAGRPIPDRRPVESARFASTPPATLQRSTPERPFRMRVSV